MASFRDKLDAACRANRSLLCVGLDPDPQRMPVSDVFQFNKAIVDATADLVCAYKPNLAFYEALGLPGLEALQRTVEHIRGQAPGVVIIGDSKRGDIGPSAQAYATALFGVWGFDATTANAYGGGDTLQPFLEWPDRGVFIWCRSSNPGAADLQDLRVDADGTPVYQELAAQVEAVGRQRQPGPGAGRHLSPGAEEGARAVPGGALSHPRRRGPGGRAGRGGVRRHRRQRPQRRHQLLQGRAVRLAGPGLRPGRPGCGGASPGRDRRVLAGEGVGWS